VRLHVHFGDALAIESAITRRDHAWTITSDPAELVAALPGLEYVFAPTPPRGIWSAAARLRLLQLAGAGADGILPAPDLPAGVYLCNARGLFAAEAAEYAIAAMLACWRGLPRLLALQRAHTWSQEPAPVLAGRTLAVLGHGEIGRRVARIGAAMDMRVIAARRRPQLADPDLEIVGPARIPDLVATADAIVVALPLTPLTRGLLSRDVLRTLRRGAVVVVISRGGIVDAHALADLASQGRIRGAAIDVFEHEPLPADDPLWDRQNVLLSPHQAGFGEDYLQRALALFVANAERIARGELPLNLVDRDAGY
jgi:phosphoglycerate dehydrogenase-like enzyme